MVQIVEALCSKSSTTKEKKRMWSQINAEAGGSLGPGVPGKPGQYRDTILKKKERERREERRGEERREKQRREEGRKEKKKVKKEIC
jgi:hypothetical protein